MRLFSFGFLIWVSALATAVQAETKIWAFSCIHEGDSNSVDILVQKNGKIKLLSNNVGDGSVKEVQPNVFEFRNLDPLFVGYLRRIKGEWKYIASSAGLIETHDCINLSDELNNVIDYYASSFDNVGGDEDLQTSLGARKLLDNLREEIKQLQEEKHNAIIQLQQEKTKFKKGIERKDRVIAGLRTRVEALSEKLYTALSRAILAEQNQKLLRQTLKSKDKKITDLNTLVNSLRHTIVTLRSSDKEQNNGSVSDADAVTEALKSVQSVTSAKASGPPLSLTERRRFKAEIEKCAYLAEDPNQPKMKFLVAMKMQPDGKVVPGSIQQISVKSNDVRADAEAVKMAFNSLRRKILRCQEEGYNLPKEKYDHWREIELSFTFGED